MSRSAHATLLLVAVWCGLTTLQNASVRGDRPPRPRSCESGGLDAKCERSGGWSSWWSSQATPDRRPALAAASPQTPAKAVASAAPLERLIGNPQGGTLQPGSQPESPGDHVPRAAPAQAAPIPLERAPVGSAVAPTTQRPRWRMRLNVTPALGKTPVRPVAQQVAEPSEASAPDPEPRPLSELPAAPPQPAPVVSGGSPPPTPAPRPPSDSDVLTTARRVTLKPGPAVLQLNPHERAVVTVAADVRRVAAHDARIVRCRTANPAAVELETARAGSTHLTIWFADGRPTQTVIVRVGSQPSRFRSTSQPSPAPASRSRPGLLPIPAVPASVPKPPAAKAPANRLRSGPNVRKAAAEEPANNKQKAAVTIAG